MKTWDTTKQPVYDYSIYKYIYLYVEMIDCDESGKMVKISGKMDRSGTYKGFSCRDISFFITRISSDYFFLFRHSMIVHVFEEMGFA